MSAPRLAYARSRDGLSLAYTTGGHGPPVVLLPTVPFSDFKMEWQNPVLADAYLRLSQRVTLVQYDGRGTGHSQRDVSDLSLEAMIGDLEAIVERSGLTTVSLIAQYISCPVAIAFAARHPDRITRLVVFGGAARGWHPLSGSGTQALLSLIEQDWTLFSESAAHAWLGWSAGDTGERVARTLRDAVSPQVARATLQTASGTDVSDLLPKVAAPALVLHRPGMTEMSVDVARDLARSLPHGRLAMLPGSQPALFFEDGPRVVDMLLDFLVDGREPVADPVADRPGSSTPHHPLTRREAQVLRLVASGDSTAEIGHRLNVSPHTVERHLANIYRKIDARGRADATAYALRHGLA